MQQITIPAEELNYLKSAHFLPGSLMRVIEEATPMQGHTWSLVIAEETVEKFREAFTEHLAKIGFDVEYQPTSEGRLLEELIDRFHSP